MAERPNLSGKWRTGRSNLLWYRHLERMPKRQLVQLNHTAHAGFARIARLVRIARLTASADKREDSDAQTYLESGTVTR